MRVEIELLDLLNEAETQAWSYEQLAQNNRRRASEQEALALALRLVVSRSRDEALTLATAKVLAEVVSPYSPIATESAGKLAARLSAALPTVSPGPES